MDTFTVAVRVPVAFDSAAEMAGWVERAIVNEMARMGWTGGAYVLFRDAGGVLHGFRDGEGFSKPADTGDVLDSRQYNIAQPAWQEAPSLGPLTDSRTEEEKRADGDL